jgi:hypothetical protein
MQQRPVWNAALVHTGGSPHVLDAETSEQQLRRLWPFGCELQRQRPVWPLVCPQRCVIRQGLLIWHLQLHACNASTIKIAFKVGL